VVACDDVANREVVELEGNPEAAAEGLDEKAELASARVSGPKKPMAGICVVAERVGLMSRGPVATGHKRVPIRIEKHL
jgi:hypothetical protein